MGERREGDKGKEKQKRETVILKESFPIKFQQAFILVVYK
jgi:hypothetical protein